MTDWNNKRPEIGCTLSFTHDHYFMMCVSGALHVFWNDPRDDHLDVVIDFNRMYRLGLPPSGDPPISSLAA